MSEAPGTVQPGQWLVEADLIGVMHERGDPMEGRPRETSVQAAALLLSSGVAPKLDLQLGFNGFSRSRFSEEGHSHSEQRSGDLCIRSKWNFIGRDGETAAAGLLAYLNIPLENDLRRGVGLLVPFSVPLGGEWSLGATAGIDRSDDGFGGRATTYSLSGYIHRPLAPRWCVYAECSAEMPGERPRRVSSVAGLGLAWAATPTVTLDLAAYCGLVREAPDLQSVLRLVWSL